MTEEELSRLFNEIANTAQSAVFSDNTNTNTTNANIPTPEPEINNLRFRSEYAVFSEHNAIEGMENMTELESTQRFSGAIWHNKIQEQEIVDNQEEIEEELEKRLEKGRSKETLQGSRKTRRPYRKRKSIATHCKGALKRGILTHLKFEFR